MSALYKNYVVLLQTLNQVLTDKEVLNTINVAFNDLMKAVSPTEETATATATDATDEVITAAKRDFIEKCTNALKGRNTDEIYSLGEKVAMLYSYMTTTTEKVSEEAIEVIHPIGTSSFKEVLGDDEYTTFMNGWQNILDKNPPSELTMIGIRKEVEETVEKQKKIKEESDKRFALNIRKKVTAAQAAMVGKKKLEKAGVVFEEGEGITLIKRKPEPEPEPAPVATEGDTKVEEVAVPSEGVQESKDD
jgi:hypothetical protein